MSSYFVMKIMGQYILGDNNIDGDIWLSSKQRIRSLQSTIETSDTSDEFYK